MKSIIAKKLKGFYGNRNGLIKPLFEIEPNQNLRMIKSDEYPNNGCIFLADYELLDSDIKGDIFEIENGFFIQEDNLYHEKQKDSNASQMRINYNTRISNFFKILEPTKLIPIYNNKFNSHTHRLVNAENISSNIFFLKNAVDEELFGPFERDNHNLKAANFQSYEEGYNASTEYKDFLDTYSEFDGAIIYRVNTSDTDDFIILDDKGNEYIRDFTKFVKSQHGEPIESTPISLLHQWAIDKLRQKSPKISEMLKEIKNIESLANTSLDELRWERYISVLTETQKDTTLISEIVKTLHNKGYIDNFAESSELEITRKELFEAKEEIITKNDEIITLKDQKEELAIELKEIQSKEIDIIDANIYPNLAKILQEPGTLKQIDEMVGQKNTHESLSAEIQKLETKREVYTDDIRKAEESRRKIEDSVKLIKKSFDEDVAVHTAKLADAKMYTDLLNGINIDMQNSHKERPSSINIVLSSLPSEVNTSRAYIAEIQRRLKSHGRDYNFNEVANLVITINQSFLTIIAGAPGVGKTSLVEKLSRCYGLDHNHGYLEINCAKGWTSSKDLIGFYNPLTGRYQQSKTRLKDALDASSQNLRSQFIVLLDEANLSPMEHYWSDFIKLADSDYSRTIKISNKEEITFGEGFKFIATINHDHTTEALSNRLLDRAAIIQIDRIPIQHDSTIASEKLEDVFDFHEVQQLFNETSKWKSDEELIKKFLKQIKDKIESNNSGIIISPRKELAIRKYCRVGTGLLDGNSYTALDFAIAQHILPLVNGRGDNFETTLKAVRADLNDKGMIKSEKLLTKIIERGKDLKHFKYIYY